MIKLIQQKKFIKRFKKLPKKIQEKAIDILEILETSPRDRVLRRHKLKGKFVGLETIDVAGDVRILIRPEAGGVVNILDIGSHNYFY